MSSDLMSAMGAAATGLRAQTVRIRISAENLANADATANTPGGDPYRRKAPVFRTGDSRFMAHCPGCGALTFWSNPAILERLR